MKTTHTKNKIMDYLQWSSDEYEAYVAQLFFDWCNIVGKYPSVTQQLFANKSVNAWFLAEFEKRETKCIAVFEAINYSLAEMQMIYRVSMNLLHNIYPSALMEAIKPNWEFSVIINNTIYYAN